MICAACENKLTPKELCDDCKEVQRTTEVEWQKQWKEKKK